MTVHTIESTTESQPPTGYAPTTAGKHGDPTRSGLRLDRRYPYMQHALSKDAAQSMDISAIVPFGEWYLHSRSAHRDPMVIEAYTQLQSETDRLFTMITRDGSPWAARE